ncbi:MAG: hypothetical protein WAV40_01495 [Microgenomates group bacterium]
MNSPRPEQTNAAELNHLHGILVGLGENRLASDIRQREFGHIILEGLLNPKTYKDALRSKQGWLTLFGFAAVALGTGFLDVHPAGAAAHGGIKGGHSLDLSDDGTNISGASGADLGASNHVYQAMLGPMPSGVEQWTRDHVDFARVTTAESLSSVLPGQFFESQLGLAYATNASPLPAESSELIQKIQQEVTAAAVSSGVIPETSSIAVINVHQNAAQASREEGRPGHDKNGQIAVFTIGDKMYVASKQGLAGASSVMIDGEPGNWHINTLTPRTKLNDLGVAITELSALGALNSDVPLFTIESSPDGVVELNLIVPQDKGRDARKLKLASASTDELPSLNGTVLASFVDKGDSLGANIISGESIGDAGEPPSIQSNAEIWASEAPGRAEFLANGGMVDLVNGVAWNQKTGLVNYVKNANGEWINYPGGNVPIPAGPGHENEPPLMVPYYHSFNEAMAAITNELPWGELAETYRETQVNAAKQINSTYWRPLVANSKWNFSFYGDTFVHSTNDPNQRASLWLSDMWTPGGNVEMRINYLSKATNYYHKDILVFGDPNKDYAELLRIHQCAVDNAKAPNLAEICSSDTIKIPSPTNK